MNFEYYIAKRITFQSKRTFSKIIIRFAIAAIALSIAVMLISVSILKGFQTEIKNKIIGFTSHIQISKVNFNYTFENEAIPYNADFLSKTKNLPQVKSANIFATKPGIIKTQNEIEGVVLKGVDKHYDWTDISSYLTAGVVPCLSDTHTSNEILISDMLAKKLNLKLEDKIELYFIQDPPRVRKFKIVGIYKTGLEEIDKTFVICDYKHIRKLNQWEDNQIGGYEIKLYDINDLALINDLLRVRVPIDEDSRTIEEIYPQIFDWLGLLNKNVRIILTLMLIVGAVNMITALLIIILEKTTMIGILKSMGCQNSSISKIFVYNAAFLIFSGVIIGNLLALLILFLQNKFGLVKLPVEYYFIDNVPVMFTWGYFILINIGTFIFCSIIMLLPALFVSRIDPLKTIRFD